jgi:DNA recombination protein RmuC
MGEHLAGLGQSLRQSVERYNRTLGALERRVLPAARRFQTLGVAMQEARFEVPAAVEVDPSEVGAPELTAPRDAAE